MAVRFDASTDNYARTTTLPPITTFSILGWGYLSVSRGAISTFFYFGQSGVTIGYTCRTGANGLTLQGNNSASSQAGTALTVGAWNHLALVVAGTGANQMQIFLNGVLDITMSGSTGPSAQTLILSGSVSGQWLNGRLAAVKVYDAVLTAADIAQEMRTYQPIRLDNLNSWYPMSDLALAGNSTDFGGSGLALTPAGTLAVEDGPPIAWAPPSALRPFASAVTPPAATSLPPRVPRWRFMRRAA
jgi:Concanavalin A-like lectin/glucanases superfamily